MHHYSLFVFSSFLLLNSVVFGQNQLCSFNASLCRGETNQGHPRRHDSPEFRGLSGDHLHSQIAGSVPENTMRCYTYKMRSCEEGMEETCVLREYRRERLPTPLKPTDSATTKYLQSPRYSNVSVNPDLEWGSRFFCIYNVSLSCPRNNRVNIDLLNSQNTWPVNSTDCENYVDFYVSESSERPNLEYCGGTFRNGVLVSTSFLAIMWNSAPRYVNRGIFNFQVTCRESSSTHQPNQPATWMPTSCANRISRPTTDSR